MWNEVERVDKRKDAQLAREVELAIPREMKRQDGIALVRDFAQREFVDRGMVADLNVHWDVAADGQAKPHAHVMLSLRAVGPEGFGKKVQEWNGTVELVGWRERWGEHVNARLMGLGIDAAVDHRSLKAQGVDRVSTQPRWEADVKERGLQAMVFWIVDKSRTVVVDWMR